MARIARVEKVSVVDGVRTITVDIGDGSMNDADLYMPPGVDAMPMKDDLVIIDEAPSNGGFVALATLDDTDTPDGTTGGYRAYARGSSGAVVAWVRMKPSGEIEIANGNGSFVMEASGKVTINGNFEVDA